MNDNELDAMLRTTMAARPEPPDATNLAARAIAMAREERRAIATPHVSPILGWLTTLAAGIAVLGVLLAGYAKLAAFATVDATTSATSSSSTTDMTPTLAVGGIGLLATLVYLALRHGLSIEDESIHIG